MKHQLGWNLELIRLVHMQCDVNPEGVVFILSEFTVKPFTCNSNDREMVVPDKNRARPNRSVRSCRLGWGTGIPGLGHTHTPDSVVPDRDQARQAQQKLRVRRHGDVESQHADVSDERHSPHDDPV